MAIGLGRMLGFHFGENFEYPYISRSITEFWRRWHISLSTFFRDYVYIPLGGNRYHAIRNIFIVWLLTGLWHGASWNFIFWGLFYGVLLFIEKTLFKKKLQKIPAPICYIYTMFFVILGWALFYFTDLNALWTFIKSAFGVGTALYDLTAVSTYECMAYCGLRNSVNSDTDNYTQEFLQKIKGICGNIGADFGYCRTWSVLCSACGTNI